MIIHHWQHNIRMNRFSYKIYFANDVSINFLFWLPVLFFSLRLFCLSTWSLCNFSLSTSSLLINFIIIYHTWFFSFEPWIFWQLTSWSQVSSCFLSLFECCECWLPLIRLSLYYERHWKCLLHKTHKHIELKKGNKGIA